MTRDETTLLPGERLDDLQCDGLKLIQRPDAFRFGTDSVLLADFATPRKDEKAVDLGCGTGAIALLMAGHQPRMSVDAVELQPDVADMANRMRCFMELGVKQGVFRDDLNMDVLMKAFRTMGAMANKESETGLFRYDELIDGTMVVLLRGIATPKGMEKLDRYRYKTNNR